MSVLPLAPPAKGPLAHYRLLSPTASVRVSPLCLGGSNFGDAWKHFPSKVEGEADTCDHETTDSILDYYYEQGGNFIDTSNNYQSEESEKRNGEWLKKRGVRDQIVLATKYTTNFHAGRGDREIIVNFNGNGSKSMRTSVRASLEKLQTDYIDLLYVHWWDFSASIPELMQSLNHLVASGKVLYLGTSDTPAWVVSSANQYARCHGLRQFSVYQGCWSAAARDFERDIIPMCRAEGMGLAPWGSLGSGRFKTEEQYNKIKADGQKKEGRAVTPTEAEIKVSKALEAVAKRKNTLVTSVAQAYVTSKAPYVFPIIGGRTLEHLKGNIEALNLKLSDEDIREIGDAVPFSIGFPNTFLYDGEKLPDHPGKVCWLRVGGTLDHVPEPKPFSKA